MFITTIHQNNVSAVKHGGESSVLYNIIQLEELCLKVQNRNWFKNLYKKITQTRI